MSGSGRASRRAEIPREETPEAFPGRSDGAGTETAVVRVGFSGDDALRLLGQLFPRQHSGRDHGNLLLLDRPFGPRYLGPLGVCPHPLSTPTTAEGDGAGLRGGRGFVVSGLFRGGARRWAGLWGRCPAVGGALVGGTCGGGSGRWGPTAGGVGGRRDLRTLPSPGRRPLLRLSLRALRVMVGNRWSWPVFRAQRPGALRVPRALRDRRQVRPGRLDRRAGQGMRVRLRREVWRCGGPAPLEGDPGIWVGASDPAGVRPVSGCGPARLRVWTGPWGR